jgi:hypothetical protein
MSGIPMDIASNGPRISCGDSPFGHWLTFLTPEAPALGRGDLGSGARPGRASSLRFLGGDLYFCAPEGPVTNLAGTIVNL